MASAEGTAFERHLAKELDGTLVPGSGNGVNRKMDVETSLWGENFLFSCKSTEKDGVRVNEDLWREVQNFARERGADLIPALGLEFNSLDNSRQFVVLSLDDFRELAMARGEPTITPTKAEIRREQSKLPPLLRNL